PPPPLYPLSLHDALPIYLPRLDIDDAGAILTRCIARRRDATAVGMPVAERVLRAGAHAEDLLRTSAVRAYHVAVAVLQPGQVLVDRKSTRLNSSHDQISY